MFLTVGHSFVQKRDKKTLLPLIKRYIHPGSRIISDGWATYKSIPNIDGSDFEHFFVNHNKNFKCPVTGVDTNTIEGKWNGIKGKIPKQGYRTPERLGLYLDEQVWRDLNEEDLWGAMLKALKTVKYVYN